MGPGQNSLEALQIILGRGLYRAPSKVASDRGRVTVKRYIATTGESQDRMLSVKPKAPLETSQFSPTLNRVLPFADLMLKEVHWLLGTRNLTLLLLYSTVHHEFLYADENLVHKTFARTMTVHRFAARKLLAASAGPPPQPIVDIFVFGRIIVEVCGVSDAMRYFRAKIEAHSFGSSFLHGAGAAYMMGAFTPPRVGRPRVDGYIIGDAIPTGASGGALGSAHAGWIATDVAPSTAREDNTSVCKCRCVLM